MTTLTIPFLLASLPPYGQEEQAERAAVGGMQAFLMAKSQLLLSLRGCALLSSDLVGEEAALQRFGGFVFSGPTTTPIGITGNVRFLLAEH